MTKAKDSAADGPVVIVKADLFTRMVGIVTGIPEKKNTIPILQHALLDVTENGLATVTMTNLDIMGSVTFQASANEAARTILPIEVIDFIAGCKGGEVTLLIAADRTFVKINQGRARMKMATLLPEDFPLMATPGDGYRFDLPANELASTLQVAEPAIADDESRPYLQGAYWHIGQGQLTAVASDGHRLHVDRLPPPEGEAYGLATIIDAKAVGALVKAFADSPESVTIQGDDNRICVSNAVIKLTSKLIEGTYAAYEQIITEPGDAWCRVNVDALTTALGRMKLLRDSAKGAGAPTARLAFEDGTLTVRARRASTDSEIEDQIDAEGENSFSMVFQISYLLDALGKAGTPSVRLAPDDKHHALRIDTRDPGQPDDAAGDRFFLIMPRRERA